MFPFFIHSDTITNWVPVILAPNSGITFGWRRVFHIMTSTQNLYMGRGQPADKHEKSNATHMANLLQVTCRVCPQDLDCNVLAIRLAHPHVGIPATILWLRHPIVRKWN